MEEKNRIVEIFNELQEKGLVLSRKEFANKMGVNYTNLIGAMKGYEKCLTSQMIARAEAIRRTLLQVDTPQPAPRKEVVIPADALELFTNLSRTVQQQAETIDRLLNGSETKKGAV